jgi:hypothetical protein
MIALLADDHVSASCGDLADAADRRGHLVDRCAVLTDPASALLVAVAC